MSREFSQVAEFALVYIGKNNYIYHYLKLF